MKKLVVGIILLGALAGVGYYFFVGPKLDLSPAPKEETDKTVQDDDSVESDEEESDSEFEIIEDSELLDVILGNEDEEESTDTRRLIPKRTPVDIYEGAFIKFSHDASLEISNETLTSMQLTNSDGDVVATIDIYTNEENLTPYDFIVGAQNLINYYEESTKNNIIPEEIYLSEKLHAVKFESFPGVVVQDIYLVVVEGYIVRVSVQDMKDSVFKTTVMTLEKA